MRFFNNSHRVGRDPHHYIVAYVSLDNVTIFAIVIKSAFFFRERGSPLCLLFANDVILSDELSSKQ